jgi:hypothetical protein
MATMDEELRVLIAADAPDDRAIRACRNLLCAPEELVCAELALGTGEGERDR